MALTQCPDCSRPLSSEVVTCPHCGKPNGSKSSDTLMAVTPRIGDREWVPGDKARCPHCGSVETTARPHTDSRVVNPIRAAAISPVKITAAQLLREYQDNITSADAKYRGTLLLVAGSIGWVDRDFVDEIVLHLRTGNNSDAIMATVNDADTKKAAHVMNGEHVVLLCKGKTRMGSAALEDCRVQ